MSRTAAEELRVGAWAVRPALGEIASEGGAVRLEPRSMEVLLALVERAPDLAPKRDLIEAVWGDAAVTDEVLTHAIWDLRRAFGDDASNPRVIQTIPKRGYRLIAAVSDGGTRRQPPTATRRALWALGTLGLVAAAVALALSVADGSSRKPLLVLAASPAASDTEREIRQRLRGKVAQLDGVTLIEEARCGAVLWREVFCLDTRLDKIGAGFRFQAFVGPPADPRDYGTPTFDLALSELPKTTSQPSEAIAEEILELVEAYLDIVHHELYLDADIKPWIDYRYDLRAIRDFLNSVQYTYRNEMRADAARRDAIHRDSSFVAPWVWMTPGVAARREKAPELIARHRGDLLQLLEHSRTGQFEKAMIRWALALLDGDRERQIGHLRIALEEQPGNRPLRLSLAVAQMQGPQLADAWSELSKLARGDWPFPAVYPTAAESAILLRRTREAHIILHRARRQETIDARTFGLLQLLALYREDRRSQDHWAEKLHGKLSELPRESRHLSLTAPAEALAQMAEQEGRGGTARRLREFAKPRQSIPPEGAREGRSEPPTEGGNP